MNSELNCLTLHHILKHMETNCKRRDIHDILGDHWENDLGAMEQAFVWTAEEQRKLDEAYNAGTNGRSPYCDDLSLYSNLLRSMVKRRLWEMSRCVDDPSLKEWLLQQCR